jgi:DNA-binding IclR family transcriptional regulator
VDASVPGISAMVAPVFDVGDRIVMSLTAIGPSAIFDVRADGAVARVLRRSTPSCRVGSARSAAVAAA